MSNEEIFSTLHVEFTDDEMLIFSRMIYRMCHILLKRKEETGVKDYSDLGYDMLWWQNKYNELNEKKITSPVI